MLQKKLIQTIAAIAGAGMLGMLVVYLACGKIDGNYVGPATLFSPEDPVPEAADAERAETGCLCNRILAGGSAGILAGLGTTALLLRRKNTL